MFCKSKTDLRIWAWILFVPFSYLWLSLTYLRRAFKRKGYSSRLPVICVGNLHSGGTGKTPTVLALAERYRDKFPVIVSRGYGGRAMKNGAKLQRENEEGASEFGDEPWMLSQLCTSDIFVGADRRKSFQAVENEEKHGLILMDDGFQNFGVQKSFSLICIPTAVPPTESFCIPAGDFREGLSALKDASALLLSPGTFLESWRSVLTAEFPGLPQFEVTYEVEGIFEKNNRHEAPEKEIWGKFCAIANPERFLQETSPYSGSALRVFPDHHAYTTHDIEGLICDAKRLGITAFLTTDKDWYKVARRFRERGARLYSLRIRAKIPAELWALTDEAIKKVS